MRLTNFIHSFINICTVLLAGVIFSLALSQDVITWPLIAIMVAVCITAVALFVKLKGLTWEGIKNKCHVFAQKHRALLRVLTIAVIILAILARLAPIIFNFNYVNTPGNTSDAEVHYHAAEQIANGYLDDPYLTYERKFPYLYVYSFTLAQFYKIIGDPLCSIVISNLIFDIIAVIFFYLFLRKIANKSTALVGVLLYLLSPLSILSCWVAMSMTIVNSLLAVILYLAAVLLDFVKQQKFLKSSLLAALLGALIYVANLYRPVYTVILIALIICLALLLVKPKNTDKQKSVKLIAKRLLPIILLVISFGGCTIITGKIVEAKFGENLLANNGGWSFYTGSNYDSRGIWNYPDSWHFDNEVIPAHDTVSGAQQQMFKEGIERYLSYSPQLLIDHFANKAGRLFVRPGDAYYNIQLAYDIDANGWRHKLIFSAIGIYFLIIVSGALIFAWQKLKDQNIYYTLLKLALLGFTAGFLLVEVMTRYTFIMYPIMMACTAIMVVELTSIRKSRQRTYRNKLKLST